MPLIDLQGLKFGKLLVLKRHTNKNADNRILWECQCQCGDILYWSRKMLHRIDPPECGKCNTSKVCPKCKMDKPFSEYHLSNIRLGKRATKCKKCIANWYSENRLELKMKYKEERKDHNAVLRKRETGRKSRNKRKDKEKVYKLSYNRRPDVMERRRKIHSNRKATDIQYNIKRRLRWRLRDVFKRVKDNRFKYVSSLVLLGCDMEFFKTHIESKFERGMSWDRIAYIHLDHIRPCSSFDLTDIEQQKKCFHWSNIQPLWDIENLIKGSKYDPNQKDIPIHQSSLDLVA